MVCLSTAPNGVLEVISTTPSISTVVARKIKEIKPKIVLFIHSGTKKVTEDWQTDIEVVSKAVSSADSQRMQLLYGN